MSTTYRPSSLLLKALFCLCVAGCGFLLANVGCSSGAVCYRQTDCPSGTKCHSGQCVRDVALGDAGSTNDEDSGIAGGAGTTASSAATAGSAGIAGSGGTATAGTGGV